MADQAVSDMPTRHSLSLQAAVATEAAALKGILLNSGHQTSTALSPILTRKIRKFWV
jgi:hypothetical protein